MTDRLNTRPAATLLMAGIVVLSLITAYIHLTLASTASLMGLLFLANAAGYAFLAVALAVAAGIRLSIVQRFSWAPRVGLAGFTALTIAGYLVMGPYFLLGWLTKAVELAILVLLLLDIVRVHGGLRGLLRDAISSLRRSPEPAGSRA
jgi:hypothetical protein